MCMYKVECVENITITSLLHHFWNCYDNIVQLPVLLTDQLLIGDIS